MATLRKQKARGLVVDRLRFTQEGKNAYAVSFTVRQGQRKLVVDVTIGPMSTLAAIEDRVLNALKPNGTL